MIQVKEIVKMKLLVISLSILLPLSAIKAQVEYEEPLAATEYGTGFLLTWITSSEDNNRFFTVERSTDGLNFENIGSVDSKGEDGQASYKFKDLELGLENVSYRLKQVITDGSSSYSNLISLKKQFVNYFQVVEKTEIAKEVFQVSVNSVKEGDLECRISNNMGDIIIEEIKSLEVGLNDFVFDFTTEIDGVYHIIFKQNNVMETVVFKKETKDTKSNVARKEKKASGG